jgi:acetyl esterase/lipase
LWGFRQEAFSSYFSNRHNTPNTYKEQALNTVSARPNFMGLVYPIITMQDDITHKGSQKNLLGENVNDALKAKYSNEFHVTKNTPPTFLVHATNDASVPVENSLKFYKALKDKGVKTDIHIYPIGGHGFALVTGAGHLQTWLDRLEDWLAGL